MAHTKLLLRKLLTPLESFLGGVVRHQIKEAIDRCPSDSHFALHLNALLYSARFIEQEIPLSRQFTPFELRRRGLELAPKDGLILEFGIWKKTWINRIAAIARERLVYGFGSYESVPAVWSMQEAGYPTADSLPPMRANVRFVKGWFEDTLPQFLAKHPERVAFVHVDCDLYSSVKTVLDLLRPRLQPGTVLILEDFFMTPGWQEEDRRTWFHFVAAHPEIGWKYIGYQREYGSVGVQISEIHDYKENGRCEVTPLPRGTWFLRRHGARFEKL